jgi:phenylacetate-CoA ligase
MITVRAHMRKLMREGSRFERIMREIEHTQFLSEGDLATWREAMLARLLIHAVMHLPFYRDLGLAEVVTASRPSEILAAFPIIDKAVVRTHYKRFIADNARRPLFKGSTSGTTGTPLTLYQDLAAINRENAFIWRQLAWAGFKRGDRRAWIRGDMVVPVDAEQPPFWRMNHAEDMLMFSSYHLSDKNAPTYIAVLERFAPAVIQAYPSSIAFLAKWLDAKGATYKGGALKGIVTSSETLDDENKALIEARFGCRVFDWYGQFERVAAIGTCEHGRQHIVSDYSFVELLPAEDGLFEIVGTGFNNFAMPLIRYRTGDFVRPEAADIACECGRHFPLVASIQGRADDVVKLPDGRHVGRLDHIFKGVEGVLEAQIRQDQIECIDILVVPTEGYSAAVESQLRSNANERLGGSVLIKVHTVSALPRTKNGKLRGVVCNV